MSDGGTETEEDVSRANAGEFKSDEPSCHSRACYRYHMIPLANGIDMYVLSMTGIEPSSRLDDSLLVGRKRRQTRRRTNGSDKNRLFLLHRGETSGDR